MTTYSLRYESLIQTDHGPRTIERVAYGLCADLESMRDAQVNIVEELALADAYRAHIQAALHLPVDSV